MGLKASYNPGGLWEIQRKLFHRVGDGRLPLHVAPEMAYELFKLRLMASERRAQVYGWTIDLPHLG